MSSITPRPEESESQKKILFERLASVMRTVSRKPNVEIRDSLSLQEKQITL